MRSRKIPTRPFLPEDTSPALVNNQQSRSHHNQPSWTAGRCHRGDPVPASPEIRQKPQAQQSPLGTSGQAPRESSPPALPPGSGSLQSTQPPQGMAGQEGRGMKAGPSLRASGGKGRWLGADMAGVLGPGGRGRQSDGLSAQLPAQNQGLDGVTGRPQERTLVGKRPWRGPQGSTEASTLQAVRLMMGDPKP